jgi:ABC-type transport system substrate-binding protein
MFGANQPRQSPGAWWNGRWAMLKEQRRTKDIEARRKIIYDIQRYAAEQQCFVYLNVVVVTASWAPYVKNYGANITFDYGSCAAALWLDR